MLKRISKRFLQIAVVSIVLLTTIGCALNETKTQDPVLSKLEAKLNAHSNLTRSVSSNKDFIAESKMSIDYEKITDEDIKYLKSLTDTELSNHAKELVQEGAVTIDNTKSIIKKGPIDANGFQQRVVGVIAKSPRIRRCYIYMGYKVSFKDNKFIDGKFVNSWLRGFTFFRYRGLKGSVVVNNSTANINSLGMLRYKHRYIKFKLLVRGSFTDTEPF